MRDEITTEAVALFMGRLFSVTTKYIKEKLLNISIP